MPLVLNQYRQGSGYKDAIGQRYHFPNRYLGRFQSLPVPFVYYEPREGGDQVYFGSGRVLAIVDDTEDASHSYADLGGYFEFPATIDFYAGPGHQSWEPAKMMRNSVRTIDQPVFDQLLKAAGAPHIPPSPDAAGHDYVQKLQDEWSELTRTNGSPAAPAVLRRVTRILEAYERPSRITNAVKLARGDKCQLCGARGFVKRDGNRYSEVHHLLHLSKNPPANCLAPEFLVVLCATCHRRMHYADVSTPERIGREWVLRLDGEEVRFVTAAPGPG